MSIESNQIIRASDFAEYKARINNLYEPASYIGMRIEGGGTIFFDYAVGYKYGSLSVAPITSNLHSYHVDKDTNVVVCDDASDTTKQNRFYVVSDYDIGDYKHGTCLMWSNGTSGTLYTSLGTSTAFGTGLSNTEKCITAATTDGLVVWTSNSYNVIWHYLVKGDYSNRSPKWFVPSKDELNVLCNMQWQDSERWRAYDESVLPRLNINFYSYYWSSSEYSSSGAWISGFYGGSMYGSNKDDSDGNHVRLVKTF